MTQLTMHQMVQEAAGPRVTIQHVRKSSYNYDRIVVSGGGPSILQKRPGLNFNASSNTFQRQPLGDYSRQRGYPVAINCEADESLGSGLYRPVNLDIFDGVAYRNFTPESEYTKEAIIMRRNGTLVPARATDGKTAQDYVDEGALWSTGHGPLLVVNGAGQDVSGFSMATQTSARTVLGQRPNGDYVVLLVEGETDVYGITGNDLVTLCVSEGLYIAMNLDGGGSTQCWWGGYYVHPSSDTEPRPRGHHLSIDVDSVPIFDTGTIAVPVKSGVTAIDSGIPALSVRQVGPTVYTQYAATVALAANTNVLLTDEFPVRFSATTAGYMRSFLQGPNGALVAIITTGGSPNEITLRAPATTTYAIGQTSHPGKWVGAALT